MLSDTIEQAKHRCAMHGLFTYEEYVSRIPDHGRGKILNQIQADCYLAAYGESHRLKLEKMFEYWAGREFCPDLGFMVSRFESVGEYNYDDSELYRDFEILTMDVGRDWRQYLSWSFSVLENLNAC